LKPIVLDCSVVLTWFFEDESDPRADSALSQLSKTEAIVPPLWFFELSNAILVAERKKRLSEADAARIIELIGDLPIAVDMDTATNALQETRLLAKEHNLSVYDAAYLELAMREGLLLATLDKYLEKAAKKAGVKVLTR